VLSTPVIRHLRKLYPDAYIAMMVRPENHDVVDNNPDLNEVILYDKYGFQKSFPGTVKFAFGLRKKRFDTAIALHPTNRVHIMLKLAGIPERIGYDKKTGWLLTKRIAHFKQEGGMHEADYNFDLLERAGFDVDGADRRPYMFTDDGDRRLVDTVMRDQAIGGDIIALHAGASCPSKRWPPERFAALADELNGKGYSIVLVGGDETRSFSDRVTQMAKTRVADITGMLLVGELAEFLSRCRLFISNDSGPVHIASAVNTPVVAIFGRKDPGLSPGRWGPLGGRDVILHKDVGCEVCLAHDCDKGFECLKAITVEEVIEASEKVLDQTGVK